MKQIINDKENAKLKVPVLIAESPLTCVAEGCGIMLSNLSLLDKSDKILFVISNDMFDIKNMRIFNEYNFGSQLLFRGIPVFIDSRCDLYSPEFNGTYNKETKRVMYLGEKKPISYSDNLELAEVESIPEKYDYLMVEHIQEKSRVLRNFYTNSL